MKQQELFSPAEAPQPETVSIPGFHLKPEYISAAEEQLLLQSLENGPWEHDWRRRRQLYGLSYSTDRKGPTWLRDFPEWLVPLAERVARDAEFGRFPENCVINEYIPPQGIGPHRDYDAFGPAVACVSVGSDVVMDFRLAERGLYVPVLVPARSFWVIRDEARWQWTHGIAPRLADVINGERRPRTRRVSITFRTAAQRPQSR